MNELTIFRFWVVSSLLSEFDQAVRIRTGSGLGSIPLGPCVPKVSGGRTDTVLVPVARAVR